MDTNLSKLSDATLSVHARSRAVSITLTWGALLCGMIGIILTFYPGHMSYDSLDQLTQARSGSFSLWHPPIMSFFWSFLLPNTLGPLPLLVLQAALFAGSLMLIAVLLTKQLSMRLFVFFGLLFFPAIFVQPGMIWKDTQLSAVLLLATSLLLLQQRTQRISIAMFVVAMLALLYGTSVRLNAFPAVVPLLLWQLSICFTASSRPIRWYYYTVFPLACACMLLLSSIITNALVSEDSPPPSQQIKIHDLAALSVASQSVLLPTSVQKNPITIERLSKIYFPSSNNALIFGGDIQLLTDPQALKELDALWKQAILASPLEYLRHRKAFLRDLISYNTPSVCYPWHDGIDKNNFGLEVTHNQLSVDILAFLKSLKNSFLFRGWLYLLLAAVLCLVQSIIALKKQRMQPSLYLSLSALCYGVPYFFVGTSCDFRYLYWVVIASLLSLLLFLFEQSSERLEAL